MLTAVITASVTGCVWWGALRRHHHHPINPEKLVWVLVIAGLLCRLSFVFFTPTFYAPDEESHYNYVKHLAEQRSFPIQKIKLGDYGNEFEYNQPPLYYLALAPLYWLGKATFGQVTTIVILLRLASVVLWGLNAWLTRLWLRRLDIKDPFVNVFVMGMVCLLPTYVFISAAINNDNLLTTIGGGLLYLLTHRERCIKISIASGFLLGLALLTKQSATVFVPAFLILAVTDAVRKKVTWEQALLHITIVGVVSAALFLPRAYWNLKTYHSLTPEFLILAPIQWPSMAHGFAATGHNIIKTFWAVSGISNNVAYPFPLLGMGLIGLCFLAQQEGFRAKEVTKLDLPGAMKGIWWITVLINIALVLRFGFISGMGQGRHLFAVLFPISLALAAGIRALPIKNLSVHAAGFWIGYALTFTAFSLDRFHLAH